MNEDRPMAAAIQQRLWGTLPGFSLSIDIFSHLKKNSHRPEQG